jgi:hypothetical protein
MLLFRRSRKMPPSWSGVAWVSELSCGTRKSERVRAGVVVGWAALDACNWSENGQRLSLVGVHVFPQEQTVGTIRGPVLASRHHYCARAYLALGPAAPTEEFQFFLSIFSVFLPT